MQRGSLLQPKASIISLMWQIHLKHQKMHAVHCQGLFRREWDYRCCSNMHCWVCLQTEYLENSNCLSWTTINKKNNNNKSEYDHKKLVFFHTGKKYSNLSNEELKIGKFKINCIRIRNKWHTRREANCRNSVQNKIKCVYKNIFKKKIKLLFLFKKGLNYIF